MIRELHRFIFIITGDPTALITYTIYYLDNNREYRHHQT